MSVDVADLTLEDSLVLDSDAFGLVGANAGSGGGAALLSHSHAAIARTTFAGNTSGSFGGALFAQGVDLDIRDSFFLRNQVNPGVSKPCFQQYGSALFTSPFDASGGRPAQAATGVVATSVVSDNQGVPIYDDDRTNGPINDTRYDANQFFAGPSSGAVFSNTVPNNVAPYSFCINAAQMSALVVQRANQTSTAKSAIGNTELGDIPPLAGLVSAPSKVKSQAVAGDPPPSGASTLGYAWSGYAAQLDGVVLLARQGVTPAAAGTHTLVVDAGAAAHVTVAPESASVLGALTALGTLLLCSQRRARAVSRDGGNAIW
jgi:predicted outer membrane repeat protein